MPKGRRIDKRNGFLFETDKNFYLGNWSGLQFSDQLRESITKVNYAIKNGKHLPLTTANEEDKNDDNNKEKNQNLLGVYKTLYIDCITCINGFEQKNQGKLKEDDTKKLEKLRRKLSKDLKTINKYEKVLAENAGNPDFKPLNFDELLEFSRSRTINVNANEIGTAGAGQSTRLIVPDGDTRLFVTPSQKPESLQEAVNRLNKELHEKYGSAADILYDNKTIQSAKKIADEMGTKDFFEKVPGFNSNGLDLATTGPDRLKKNLKTFMVQQDIEVNLDNLKTPLETRIFAEFTSDLSKTLLSHNLNKALGISSDTRQDKRNSAMSMVADLFKIGDVVAHSENVNLVINDNGNKKIIKATAMNEASGEDLSNVDSSSNFIKISQSSFDNPQVIKDIANLQLLDYICGNADRHPGNICYKVDENGKVCGIQGIDNDTSLGADFTEDGTDGKCVPLSKMSIIPKSTAMEILNTDSEVFLNSLFGYDVKTAEAEAAVLRFEKTKDMIRESMEAYSKRDIPEGCLIQGLPRIVDNDKLAEYSSINDLSKWKKDSENSTEAEGNLFGLLIAETNAETAGKTVMKSNINKAVKIQQGFLGEGFKNLTGAIKDIEVVDKIYQKGSKQYTSMRTKVTNLFKDIKNFNGVLLEQKYPDDEHPAKKNQYQLSADASAFKFKIKAALEDTNTYINDRALKKPQVFNKRTNTREWKRYQAALKTREELRRMLEVFKKAEAALNDNDKIADGWEAMVQKAKERDEAHAKNVLVPKKELRMKNEIIAEFNMKKVKIIESSNSSPEDIFKAKLDFTISKGMRAVAGKDISSLPKDDPSYLNYRKAVAASIVKEKLDNPDNASLKNIVIKDNDDFDKCLDNIMKHPAFEKTAEAKNPLTTDDCVKFCRQEKNAVTFTKQTAEKFAEAANKTKKQAVLK